MVYTAFNAFNELFKLQYKGKRNAYDVARNVWAGMSVEDKATFVKLAKTHRSEGTTVPAEHSVVTEGADEEISAPQVVESSPPSRLCRLNKAACKANPTDCHWVPRKGCRVGGVSCPRLKADCLASEDCHWVVGDGCHSGVSPDVVESVAKVSCPRRKADCEAANRCEWVVGKGCRRSDSATTVVDQCNPMTTQRYTTRPSPPYKAGTCPGEAKTGNDGRLYLSKQYVVGGKPQWRWTAQPIVAKVAIATSSDAHNDASSESSHSSTSSEPSSEDSSTSSDTSVDASRHEGYFLPSEGSHHADLSDSCHGMVQGGRPSQEDRYDTYKTISSENKPVTAWAVYDGHGGETVSDHLKSHQFLKQLVDTLFVHKQPATKRSIVRFVRDWDEKNYKEKGFVGSTMNAAVLVGNELTLVNLGDSRSALFTEPDGTVLVETKDHKPSGERARLEGAYERSPILFRGYIVHPTSDARLAVSRAFGDSDFKIHKDTGDAYTSDGIVSSVPDVYHYSLHDLKKEGVDHAILVLATDGIWDGNDPLGGVLSAKATEKMAMAVRRQGLGTACQTMMKERQFVREDNKAIIMVRLNRPTHEHSTVANIAIATSSDAPLSASSETDSSTSSETSSEEPSVDVNESEQSNEDGFLSSEESRYAVLSDSCDGTDQGGRDHQEDRYDMYETTSSENKPVTAWAVYDGHGGETVSDHLKSHQFLKQLVDTLFVHKQPAAKESIVRFVRDWDEKNYKESGPVGSTMNAAVLVGNELTLVNLGDSRSALFTEPDGTVLVETKDHKPSGERARLEGAYPKGANGRFPIVFRGYVVHPTSDAGLAVSRAFGDSHFKIHKDTGDAYTSDGIVSAVPDVYHYSLHNLKKEGADHAMLVLATDGVWDCCSPKGGVLSADATKLMANIVQQQGDEGLNNACQIVMGESTSGDNKTIIMVRLNHSARHYRRIQKLRARYKDLGVNLTAADMAAIDQTLSKLAFKQELSPADNELIEGAERMLVVYDDLGDRSSAKLPEAAKAYIEGRVDFDTYVRRIRPPHYSSIQKLRARYKDLGVNMTAEGTANIDQALSKLALKQELSPVDNELIEAAEHMLAVYDDLSGGDFQ